MNPLQIIVAGPLVRAEALVLDAPISFWGGIDNETGEIIDHSHPQRGVLIGGTCLIVPMIRGSGGTPGSLADLLRRGCGPKAIILGYPDINVMTGIIVAATLYETTCPLFIDDQQNASTLQSGTPVTIDEAGFWTTV